MHLWIQFMMHTQFNILPFSKVFQCRFYILWKEMIRNALNFCFQPYATKVCYTLLHCAFLTDTPLTRSWKLQTKFYPMHSPLIRFLTAFSSNTYFLQQCFVSIINIFGQTSILCPIAIIIIFKSMPHSTLFFVYHRWMLFQLVQPWAINLYWPKKGSWQNLNCLLFVAVCFRRVNIFTHKSTSSGVGSIILL